jgi:hypothetical protein
MISNASLTWNKPGYVRKRRQLMPEIHVYVPAGLAESQDIHIHVTQPGDEDIHVTQPGDETQQSPDVIKASHLARMAATGSASPHLKPADEELEKLGYKLRVPKLRKPGTKPPEKYLRITHPAYTAHDIGRLTLTTVIFTRGKDRDRLAGLDGAQLTERDVRFSITTGIDQALNAARLIDVP